MTSPSKDREEASPRTPFWILFLLGTCAAIVGNLAGWLLVGCVILVLLSEVHTEAYGIIGITICFPVGPVSSLMSGLFVSVLSPAASRSRPDRVDIAALLLGFSLGVATWVVMGLLVVVLLAVVE